MPLMETALVALAGVLTRTIASVWIGDVSLREASATTLAEGLGRHVGDALRARQIERKLAELGDRVVSNLKPLLDGQPLEDGARAAVVLEIKTTIEKSDISPSLIRDHDNNPQRLCAYLKRTREIPSATFSGSERALYDRALGEVSVYLIDLTFELPRFVPETLTEILERLSDVQPKIDRIFSNVEAIRAISEGNNTQLADAQFESTYRSYIARSLDRVELIGSSLSADVRRYNLTVSYVSLELSTTSALDSDEDAGSFMADPTLSTIVHPAAIALSTAFGATSHALIIGEAGSGKTTLLKWLAVKATRGEFEEGLHALNGLLPVFLELRRFKGDLPEPEQFMTYAAPKLAGQVPAGWLQSALSDGRVLLLLDGLDEVPGDLRDAAVDWIEDLVDTFPLMRVVATSRPAAVSTQTLAYHEFEHWTISPMGRREVAQFVQFWHQSVLGGRTQPGERSARHYEERAIAAIEASSALTRLATTPLLCAMICALHYDRHMSLPQQRRDLYEACIEMLLERRDIEREILEPEGGRLDYSKRRILLEAMALWMLENGYATASNVDLLAVIEARLAFLLDDASKLSASSVLKSLVERSGLLREVAHDQIDFIHKTFQEYLAASGARREGRWGQLLSHAGDDQWSEAIVLAASQANVGEADRLVGGLLDLADGSGEADARFLVLAASCVEVVQQLSPAIRGRAQEGLAALVPPATRSARAALIAAGDIAVPFLSWRETFSPIEARACAHVLLSIASSAALRLVRQYLESASVDLEFVSKRLLATSDEELRESGLDGAIVDALATEDQINELIVPAGLLEALNGSSEQVLRRPLLDRHEQLTVVDWLGSKMPLNVMFPGLTRLSVEVVSHAERDDAFGVPGIEHLVLLFGNRPSAERFALPQVRRLTLATSTGGLPSLAGLLGSDVVTHIELFSATGTEFPELADLQYLPALEEVVLGTRAGALPDLAPLAMCATLRRLVICVESKVARVIGGALGLEDVRVSELVIRHGEDGATERWVHRHLDRIRFSGTCVCDGSWSWQSEFRSLLRVEQ